MTPLASPRQTGFTLIELIVVVTIVAITAAIALPSFNESIVRNRLAAQTNEFIAGINLARTASLELNTGGGICAANDDRDNCGGSWDNGWIVWADENRNNSVDAGEIRASGAISDKDELTGVLDIRFDGRGRRVLPAPGAAANLEMKPTGCSTGKEHFRTLTVSALGSVSVTKGSC